MQHILTNKIKPLLAEHRPGHTLPQPFYTDPDIFEFELQAIFYRQWLQVALEIEIPNPEDYLPCPRMSLKHRLVRSKRR